LTLAITPVLLNTEVFWVLRPCGTVNSYRRFEVS